VALDGMRFRREVTGGMQPDEITVILMELEQGVPGAADRLAPLVYDTLHGLAAHFMRAEREDHTLQPTVLVHDAYMRLMGERASSWNNRAHFFSIAAQAMRRMLVDHARRRRTAKRDGGDRVTLDDHMAESPSRSVDLLALDDALTQLAALDARQARVVELRYFGGLTVEQTAEAIGVSPATVKRDWSFARAFLQRALDDA